MYQLSSALKEFERKEIKSLLNWYENKFIKNKQRGSFDTFEIGKKNINSKINMWSIQGSI